MSNEVKNLEANVVPGNVLSFIHDKLETDMPWEVDSSSAYTELLEYLPVDVKKPSYSEWIFFYNVHKRQQMVDKLHTMIFDAYTSIKVLSEEIANCDQDDVDRYGELVKSKRSMDNRLRDLEKRYADMSRDLLKYVNDAVNRETPRKQEILHKTITPSDVLKLIDNGDNYVEAEFEVKD